MRLVSVMQHIHDMRATDPFGIVETGILVAAGLQIRDTVLGAFLHVLFGTEEDGLRGTGLGTSWSLPHRHAIGAERAFMRDVILARDARNVEWAALDTITAADAVLVNEIDDAV